MAKKESYEQFVEKFKPKKTTDDCYTPPAVYNTIKEYVCERFGVDESKIIRPFYPNGDYENEDYRGKVVVDNPPFSILSKILRFYRANKVPYFLFKAGLKLNKEEIKAHLLITGSTIEYENGAKVVTDFVTNLSGKRCIESCPALGERIIKCHQKNKDKGVAILPKNVLRAWDFAKLARHGVPFVLENYEGIRKLEKAEKAIYGGGVIISDKDAERMEKAREVARKNKIAKDNEETIKKSIIMKMGNKELEIIKALNEL